MILFQFWTEKKAKKLSIYWNEYEVNPLMVSVFIMNYEVGSSTANRQSKGVWHNRGKNDIFTLENVNMNFLGKHSRIARLSWVLICSLWLWIKRSHSANCIVSLNCLVFCTKNQIEFKQVWGFVKWIQQTEIWEPRQLLCLKKKDYNDEPRNPNWVNMGVKTHN